MAKTKEYMRAYRARKRALATKGKEDIRSIPDGMSEESYERYRSQGNSDEQIAKIWEDTLKMRAAMIARAEKASAAARGESQEGDGPDLSYRLQHQPGNPLKYPDEVPTVDKITTHGSMPPDVLDHPDWYADGYDPATAKSVAALKRLQGNPDKRVWVYRGAPVGELNTGDWVTLDKSYAKQYAGTGAYSDNKRSKVYAYRVKASELSWDGDSFMEFGYWGSYKKAPK